jgi:hypothetical protein
VTRRESAAMLDWVAAGGRLVVVAAPLPLVQREFNHADVLDAVGLEPREIQIHAWDATQYDQPSLREGLGRLDWPSAWELHTVTAKNPLAGTPQVLVSNESRPLAVRVPFGTAGGEVVGIADATLLDNEWLRREDNAVLALRLLLGRASDGGRVAFDEFHHGFRADGKPGSAAVVLAGLLFSTWPGRALLFLAFAGLVHVAGAAVRLGAPDREKPPPRRALSEHAEALGRIFETARAGAEALRILAAGARRVVGQRTGIPSGLPPFEFEKRLASSPAPGAAELADAMRVADGPRAPGGSRTLKDSDMARIAATLAAAKRRFLHGGD